MQSHNTALKGLLMKQQKNAGPTFGGKNAYRQSKRQHQQTEEDPYL